MARNKNQQTAQASSSFAQSVQSNKPESNEMPGKLYELGLFMYVLTKKTKLKDFDIGKEVKIADKFDDLVVRLNERGNKRYTFLQAKLVDNAQDNPIDADVLLGKKAISLHKDDFNLRKYFISYLRIKDQLNSRDNKSILEKLIIFTNAKIVDSLTVNNNNIGRMEHSKLDESTGTVIPKTHNDAKCYKIKQAVQALKEHLSKGLKSDLKRLSEELAKYITTTNLEPMVLDKDYFNYYHTALVDEKIVEIQEVKQGNKVVKQGQFTQEFINNDNTLSNGAKELRGLIVLEITKKQLTEDALNNAKLPVSDDFGVKKIGSTKIYLPTYDIADKSVDDFFRLLEFRVNESDVKGLFNTIKNKQIKEAFLAYYDTDPRLIEFIVKDFVEKWKNSGGSTTEGWILNSQREQFIKNLESNISKPKAKHKTWEYIQDLNKVIQEFNLHFDDDCSFQEVSFPVDKKAFSIGADSTLLSSIKMIKYLEKRSQQDYIFINLESLIKKEEVKELIKTFQDDEFKLLILCYGSSLDDSLQQELFDNLSLMMQGNQKGIVLITSVISDALSRKFESEYNSQGKYKAISDKPILLEHISNPSKILAQEILFQGQSIPLDKLITQDKDSIKSIDAKIIEKLITNKGKEISVGSKPSGTSDLEGAYAELSEEVNQGTLKTNLVTSSPEVIYVISGIPIQDGDRAKKRFIENLKFRQNTVDNNNKRTIISSKINILRPPYSLTSIDKTIQLVDSGFAESNFKDLCDSHSGKKVYWIKWDESKFTPQKIYSPDFYTTRWFNKVVIKTKFENKPGQYEILTQATQDKFVFSGINNNELAGLFDLATSVLNNDRIFVVKDENEARSKFNDLDGTVHWLEVGNKNNGGNQQIIWRNSKGSLDNLRKYFDKEQSKISLEDQYSLLQFIEDKKAVIIADDPGMGKSTTLVKLYQLKYGLDNESKLVDSHWVINVNLREHLKYH
ncbi:hypothetical protein [Cardinium endosymbiont of Nabis limbatus]|uniref:hypothetical protein n=1 Tax=Cardinium endosymbiont of Nabis limbatus TaxID=3066217 RepID=UPI003AF3E91A